MAKEEEKIEELRIEKLPEGYYRDRDSDTDFSDIQEFIDKAKLTSVKEKQ